MTEFSFVGNVDELSDIQKELIANIFKEQGFKCGEIDVSVVGKAGDNYVANVKRLTIENNGESFKVVVKVAPTLETVRLMMQTKIMFQNETIMYTEVLPKFTQMEIESEIPDDERLRYAKCFGTITTEPYEMLVLEDLQLSDFVILDRFGHFTDGTVKLVLKNFAILHSHSFALKNRAPETFEKFAENLNYPWTARDMNPDIEAYFAQLEKDVLSILENESDKKLVKGSLVNLMGSLFENKKLVNGSKYSVISQGDSWINNIMFRLKDKEAIECCMIDYQISNENSPVADIHYMIFNCTDHETRSKYYYDWINYYHTQLDKCLSKFSLDVNIVYPRAQLDLDLKRFGEISFGLSVMLATMLIREASEAQTFKDALKKENNMEEVLNICKLENMKKMSLNRFKKKVTGLIASFVELGYI